MNACQFLVLRTAVSVAALPATGFGAGFLMDPVVTYTNGMPLASATSLRSHNVYWQGDPDHVGEIDGGYNCPCLNDLHLRRKPYVGFGEPPRGHAEHLPDGLEMETSEIIGAVSIDPSAARRPLAPVVPQPAPAAADAPSGGIWLDALQSLQRKIMIDPERGY